MKYSGYLMRLKTYKEFILTICMLIREQDTL